MRLIAIAALAVCVCAASQQSPPAAPRVIAAPLPYGWDTIIPSSAPVGEARFRATVADGVVTDIQRLGSTSPLLAQVGEQALRAWRFEPGPASSFETTFRHAMNRENRGCETDPNQVVRAQLPGLVEVTSGLVVLCDPIVTVTTLKEPISQFAGTIRCDCAGRRAISGATVSVLSVPSEAQAVSRTVRSDGNGEFRVLGLSPGRYRVDIAHAGYQTRGYEFAIALNGGREVFDVALQPEKPIRRPEALVVGATIPSYPQAARASGIQGTAVVRLSMQGDDVLDINAESDTRAIGEAAAANAQTWRFRGTAVPVLTIRFEYRLVPGDCTRDPSTTVTMRFPHEVRVEATRCSPAEPFSAR